MPTSLLRPYYWSFRNRFRVRDACGHTNKRDFLLIIVALLVMFCIFTGFVMILNALEDDPLFRQVIPTKIIELLFYAFFVLLLISNTISATGNIYTAKNMDLFLSTPVSSFRLYLAKLLETLVETSLMFVIFILPAGLAYWCTLDLSAGFFPGSALVIAPFLIIPAGIAVVLATFFVKFASVVWRRGYFLLLCLIAIGGWALISLVSILQRVKLERGGANAIVQLIGLFDNPNPTWLPSRWTVDLISYFVTGSIEAPGLKLMLLWITAAGSVALGFLAFDFFLLPVRSAAGAQKRLVDGPDTPTNQTDIMRRILEVVYLRLPINMQFRAIMLKDLTSVVRDRAQSLQLIMYLGIAVVAVVIIEFMSAALNLTPVGLQVWWGFLASINILFSGFIITALMTRLVYPSISLEGKAFWILRTAPIELSKLIYAKFWCWLPLTMIIGSMLIFAGIISIFPTPLLVGASLFIGVCLSIGCTGLAIGVGAIFASFEWESPTQIASGFGTLVLLLSSLSLVLLTCAPASTLLFILAVETSWAKFGHQTAISLVIGCTLLIPLINITVAYIACKKGVSSLKARNIG